MLRLPKLSPADRSTDLYLLPSDTDCLGDVSASDFIL